MAEETRIRILVDRPPAPGRSYVLYWMQQSQRTEHNPALDHAIELANGLGLPVVVGFGLTDGYPEANARHYLFLLQGLAGVRRRLEAAGIGFVIRKGAPDQVALDLSKDAALTVCDRGYLEPQRRWRRDLTSRIGCRLVEVEGDVVVPLETVSPKHEFAARTIRSKIERLRDDYLAEAPGPRLRHKAGDLGLTSDIDLSDPAKTVSRLKVDHSIGPVRRFEGGLEAARERLRRFLGHRFDGYAEGRGEPARATVSHMSPYLHFGQISPVEIALAAREAKAGRNDRAAFLEELIVRRELAMNHVFYEPHHDRYEGLPEWARATLDQHRKDPRPHHYGRARLEAGDTHDRVWNAAMREMRETGYMHNRLRMYWGKKIVEWSRSPEEAFATALHINNRYFLDGRDANSFTNVGWLFGLHDRPWFRRPIFGTVRYMGENSLRKFDAEAYLRSVEELCAREGD